MELSFGMVDGLPEEDQKKLNELIYVYTYHRSKNRKKRRYYNGNITLGEVNLGIALPRNISKLSIGCEWGAKTVDVLAGRSMFDGFVSEYGNTVEGMAEIIKRNKLIAEYKKACKDELEYGCVFAVVSGKENGANINFYSPQCAAALWDGEKKQIDCGFAFDDQRRYEEDWQWSPNKVTYFTSSANWVLEKVGTGWSATEYRHDFGKPMMIPMVWKATNDAPFGKSRINGSIRKMIQGYVRTIANATIGLEFATAPQKYLLGITDEQYDAIVDQKFQQYVGSILAGTPNPETGNNPVFGQLPQGNISPHVEMLRILATQFSAASGLTVTDTGVVNDANPTSSDAILAQSQTLVSLAQELNTINGDALNEIAVMALAVEKGIRIEDLEDTDVVAHFKNPAMPSVAVTADAAIKIASARENFSSTDVFLEMIGFDQADIRRIKAQEQRARGQNLLLEETEKNLIPEQINDNEDLDYEDITG